MNYNNNENNNNNLMTSDGKIDVLSNKLLKQIENVYYTREHLILYTVISLVKMLIILLMFFIIRSPNYWCLWTIIIDIFALYVIIKATNQICFPNNNNKTENTIRYVNNRGDFGILDEWIAAMINIVSVTSLLIVTTLIISLYPDISKYKQFINQRLLYLQILGAIEIVWFASQFVLWKLNFYRTIFYPHQHYLVPSTKFM